MLLKKRVVSTKLDIYRFIISFINIYGTLITIGIQWRQ
jgi:hypothetical protein